MRKHYDFGKMKSERNPYVKALKQPITMRLDKSTVTYFKALAAELGMPYQSKRPASPIYPFRLG